MVDKINKSKNNEENKKSKFFLIILGFVIVFLIFSCIWFKKWYFLSDNFSFDSLTMKLVGYKRDEKENYKLVKDNGKCTIIITTTSASKIDLKDLGVIDKIKNKEWAKEEFSNGLVMSTEYDNMLYIVKMYAMDSDTYESVCQKDFYNIKNTFSFFNE